MVEAAVSAHDKLIEAEVNELSYSKRLGLSHEDGYCSNVPRIKRQHQIYAKNIPDHAVYRILNVDL
jgi:hypothetical protein